MRSRISGQRSAAIALSLLLGVALACILLVQLYPYPVNFSRFPRVTRTRSGAPGDPINVIVVGSQAQITRAFLKAGWLIPDPITAQTSARIAAASLSHQRYPTAPVSNLFAFGHAQDLAFEKPTNDVQYRGHVRLWNTGELIDGQEVWVGQASYDSGIELSATNELPTHHIAPAVDIERDTVGADLSKTGITTGEQAAAYTAPVLYARNGGGDAYENDGDALVINLTQASFALQPEPGLIGALKTGEFSVYDTIADITGTPIAFAILIGALIFVDLGLYLSSRRRQIIRRA